MTSRLTVIRSELSAWICQPFCCQRTFALIPSEPLSIPLKDSESSSLQLRTSNIQKIKNPASSAGLSHHTGGSARSSTYFYPVLVKNLTIGSTSWPSLDNTLGRRFFDPPVTPLLAQLPPSHLQVYKIPGLRQAPPPNYFRLSCAPLCKTMPLHAARGW